MLAGHGWAVAAASAVRATVHGNVLAHPAAAPAGILAATRRASTPRIVERASTAPAPASHAATTRTAAVTRPAAARPSTVATTGRTAAAKDGDDRTAPVAAPPVRADSDRVADRRAAGPTGTTSRIHTPTRAPATATHPAAPSVAPGSHPARPGRAVPRRAALPADIRVSQGTAGVAFPLLGLAVLAGMIYLFRLGRRPELR